MLKRLKIVPGGGDEGGAECEAGIGRPALMRARPSVAELSVVPLRVVVMRSFSLFFRPRTTAGRFANLPPWCHWSVLTTSTKDCTAELVFGLVDRDLRREKSLRGR